MRDNGFSVGSANGTHLYQPQQVDSMEIYARAIFAPGLIFSARGEFRNYIRLKCGNLWTAEIEQAMKRLGEIIAGVAAC